MNIFHSNIKSIYGGEGKSEKAWYVSSRTMNARKLIKTGVFEVG